MSLAEQRRRELEDKKAKLAEMKRAREERMAAAKKGTSVDAGAARTPVSQSTDTPHTAESSNPFTLS